MKGMGRIFILDDDELITSMLSRALKKEGYEVHTENSPERVVEKVIALSPHVVMLDIMLPGSSGIDILKGIKAQEPDMEVVMLTADDTAETAVRAMKLGASDYLTKPFNIDEVRIVLKNIIEKERLKKEVDYLRKIRSDLVDREIIGESDSIKEVLAKIESMAEVHVSTILITGESGTGKELMARYIHNLICKSDDSAGYAPFIAINCTALPEPLIESELFGYDKGAFTDAKSDKKGLFELADGGSLLLDEIGDMKMGLQSKLLRVLEDRKIRRLGGKKDIPVDVTVIATTNRDLSEAVRKDEFRMDLFFRLNTFSVQVPPLRERRDDIPELSRHFLSYFTTRYNKRSPKGISAEAEQILLLYNWPGNVRELKNVIERIAALESVEVVLPEHLPIEITRQVEGIMREKKGKVDISRKVTPLREIEKGLIVRALAEADNNKALAAKLLNISYDTLRYRLKKYGLE